MFQDVLTRVVAVYQDLSTHHDWPVEYAIVNSPIRLKKNSKHTFSNSLSSSGVQNKGLGAASQTLLAGVRLRVRRTLNVAG